jgi:hypothetical protein
VQKRRRRYDPRCFRCYNCDVKRPIFTVKDTHRINSSLSNCRHTFDFGIHIDTRLAEHQYVSKINQIQKHSDGTLIWQWTVIFVENNLKSTNLSIRRAASTHGNIIFVSTVWRIGLGNQINYDSTINGIFIFGIGPRM